MIRALVVVGFVVIVVILITCNSKRESFLQGTFAPITTVKVNSTDLPSWKDWASAFRPNAFCQDRPDAGGSVSGYFHFVTDKSCVDDLNDINTTVPKGWYHSDIQKGNQQAAMETCYASPQCNWFMTRGGINYYYNRPFPKECKGDQLSGTVYGIKDIKRFLSGLGSLSSDGYPDNVSFPVLPCGTAMDSL